MVKLTKIYTKTGDDGTTGLGTGGRVRKDDARVEGDAPGGAAGGDAAGGGAGGNESRDGAVSQPAERPAVCALAGGQREWRGGCAVGAGGEPEGWGLTDSWRSATFTMEFGQEFE